MDAINCTELRKKLKEDLDRVYSGHEPLIVTHRNKRNVVLLSIKNF